MPTWAFVVLIGLVVGILFSYPAGLIIIAIGVFMLLASLRRE